MGCFEIKCDSKKWVGLDKIMCVLQMYVCMCGMVDGKGEYSCQCDDDDDGYECPICIYYSDRERKNSYPGLVSNK